MKTQDEGSGPTLLPNRFKAGVVFHGAEMYIYLTFLQEGETMTIEMPLIISRKQALNVIEGLQQSIQKFDELKMSN